jgi:hypothetical protein
MAYGTLNKVVLMVTLGLGVQEVVLETPKMNSKPYG